ncbi:N-acetyltransferase eco [Lucilia cuprina]|uniref:N-acetyltransferase eco n=1 Tax=Lucilia cuprina TaxID=7375 RepID=A0A0L0C6K2_LUCCU|nr:N-acetyltransferase eco [Lucilia cuprina]KNC27890.1 N-acetyltransferase eco [Lucilia cuprina]
MSIMETPKSDRQQIRTMRNHTPRLSERKKKLFGSATQKDNELECEGEEEMLKGIAPLASRKSRNTGKTPKSTKIMESLMGSCKKSPRVISFFETESEDGGDTAEEQKPSPSRRSVRLSLKKSPNSSKSEGEFSTSPHKENIPLKTPTRKESQEDKKLQKMFSNSMQITPRDKTPIVIDETSSEDEENEQEMKDIRLRSNKKCLTKRHCEIEGSTGLSPMRKKGKTSISPIEGGSISTKSFYSGKNTKTSPTNNRASCRNLFGQTVSGGNTPSQNKARASTHSRRSIGSQATSINRGVHHKIRKRSHPFGLPPKHYAPVDIDHILNNVRNEKLRKLITAKREEKQQIEKIHSIFRQASNPIAMARPLSSISQQDDSNNNNIKEEDVKPHKPSESSQSTYQNDTDFSDIECDMEEFIDEDDDKDNLENALMAMNEEVIPLITHQADDALSVKSEDSSAPVKRKFFKSGRSTNTRKEVHITDNIKAMVTANGKLSIVPEKKKVKRRIKIRNSVTNEFSDEQATVDAILRNLDDTAFGDIIVPKDENEDENSNLNNNDNNAFLDEIDQQLALMNEEESSSNLIDDIVLQDNQDFNDFRKRLPYNTNDPEIIERQHLLLDFLITNNICTEENFNIFIADPDNHKAEAERIIDELVIVVTDHQNTDFRQRIPYNTTDPELIEQQHSFLDFLLENNICTEENFDIFIANYGQRKAEADAIIAQYLTGVNGQYNRNLNALTTTGNHVLSVDKQNMNLSTNSYKTDNTYETSIANTTTNNNNNITTLPEQLLQTPTPTTALNINNNVPTHSGAAVQETTQLNETQQQKLFPVFYPGGCQPLNLPSTRRKQQQRAWNAGYGSNQYQIDAGQKSFGAHQCKQCGLVYTVHEPEEEKLHRDFHASLHILRFKGWIDEDIVAIYPEWGPDGRILRLTESSPPKRRERLMDILKIVDKELGFSSYIVPKTFVAYFAVRKMQIVGLCLVQPLDKANKYLCVNGVDCCTEEQFEAKCGISRIWVSPLHRRFHIGAKLIQAVQLNTIFGEEVQLDKIAFSAPTEMGKAFAQKITQTENFLVYQ